MVEENPDVDALFKALADPVRRTILTHLTDGPATVGDLANPLAMSFAGASKHVAILVDARLVTKTRKGRQQICTLRPEPLQQVQAWLDQYATFWTDHLDHLETALNAAHPPDQSHPQIKERE